MKNADMPAYPVTDEKAPPSEFGWVCGLTKRELIAAMAMQGILSNETYRAKILQYGKPTSIEAVQIADALLAELEKK